MMHITKVYVCAFLRGKIDVHELHAINFGGRVCKLVLWVWDKRDARRMGHRTAGVPMIRSF